MNITDKDLWKVFIGTLNLNLKILRNNYNVKYLNLSPSKKSYFYLKDDNNKDIDLYVPCDNVIGKQSVINGSWEKNKLDHLEKLIDNKKKYVLVDVGANVGLFSRQCLSKFTNISKVFTYEPHPEHYNKLKKNFQNISKVSFHNNALGDKNEQTKFYTDTDNAGQFSLIKDRMKAQYAEIKVDVLSANLESKSWLLEDNPIIYKSDTEGMDIRIATNLEDDFWDKVAFGFIEITKKDYVNFDEYKFINILKKFNKKVFTTNLIKNLKSIEIINYLKSENREEVDLYLWKD
jgi:FkbM family methyltransferase